MDSRRTINMTYRVYLTLKGTNKKPKTMSNFSKKLLIAFFAIFGEIVFSMLVMFLIMVIVVGNLAGCNDLGEFITLFFKN